MTDQGLTIGQLAKRAGINISAVRYYEREGLLPEPPRIGGRRHYDLAAVSRLGVIDVAKRAGFTLDEVRVLLQSTDQGAQAHDGLSDLAQRKLPEIDALIERAVAMRSWLQTATTCGCATFDACALFDAQAAPGPDGGPTLQLTQVRAG